MFKNYLLVAIRSLTKQKLYAFINIFGLAVGLACFVLILLYVRYELSYDTFHENADRVYRVVQYSPGSTYMGSEYFGVTPAPLAGALVNDFPEVTHATAFDESRALLSVEDRHFYEDGVTANEQFFEVFPFTLLQGDPASVLAEPGTIVLTASLADKIFATEPAMGRTIVFENDDVVTVTGIMEDVPDNAHFTPKFVTSLVASPGFTENLDNWSNSSWFTYFVLMNGVDHAGFEEKLNVSLEELRYDEDDDDELSLYRLQALTSIHLHSHINFELSANNDIKYIYLFTVVAFLILLIACVNYMNLATARSIKRAREVGIRKVVGAYRFQLLIQYIGESVLLAFLALVLGLLLVYLLLPAFNQWLGKELSFGFSDHSQFYLILMGVTLGVGLISGSYPALFMSSLKPVSVLRGTFGRIAGGTRLQQYLMVGQQAVSIVLVVASIIIYRQLQFIQRKEVGYNREHVLVMSARDWDLGDRLQIFRDELMRDPNVINVALSSSLPTRISSQTTARKWEGSVEGDELPIYNARVNYDFIDVYEIEMVEGRNFSRDYPTDTTNAYILNETAVRSLGWEAGVGKQFDLWGNEGPVIGVVKDIHMHSLHMPIKPLLLYLDNDRANYVSVRIGSTDVPSTMSHIESTVKAFTPYPFEYTFLDETYVGLYRSEAKLGQCMGYFALLALLIASLGVFGMAAFSSEQRTKEIGVRKVLGASIPDILLLLSITYTKQVMVAFVIAIPMAYFGMTRWLEEFAYRVTIHPVIFLVSLISIVLIAWCSVLYQSIRAARVNPVNSLRNE